MEGRIGSDRRGKGKPEGQYFWSSLTENSLVQIQTQSGLAGAKVIGGETPSKAVIGSRIAADTRTHMTKHGRP